MATELLVGPPIADGESLITELVREGFDITVAFWVRKQEYSLWELYLGSASVSQDKRGEEYHRVFNCLGRIPATELTPSDIRLVHASDPIVRDAVVARDRYGGRIPRKDNGRRLGNLHVEDIYFYPHFGPDERWRGLSIVVYPDPSPSSAFHVEFWPRELQFERGPEGEPRRVPRPASVRVEGGQVKEFSPPERPYALLLREDYVSKELEAVEKQGMTRA